MHRLPSLRPLAYWRKLRVTLDLSLSLNEIVVPVAMLTWGRPVPM